MGKMVLVGSIAQGEKEDVSLVSRQDLSLMVVVVVMIVAAMLAVPCSAEDKPDPAVLFAKNCKMCHRADGKGIPAMKTPDFTNKEWQASRTDAELIRSVTKGKDKMPAFENKLKPEEIKLIISDVIRKFVQ